MSLHKKTFHKQAEHRYVLSLKAIVASQQALVLLVCAKLDGSVRDDSHHGGRVSPPQTEEALHQVGAVDQPVSFL